MKKKIKNKKQQQKKTKNKDIKGSLLKNSKRNFFKKKTKLENIIYENKKKIIKRWAINAVNFKVKKTH